MPKVKNPQRFSDYFNISKIKLSKIGVLDPTLAIDTKLFIDPLLFEYSSHNEFKFLATRQYIKHFETIIKFLSKSRNTDDVAWRSARSLLEYHEIKGTCLGYGAGSISGSGMGAKLTNRMLLVGKEIVDLGITDPELFSSMALFESDIGPDRISDMTTNVINKALISFNERILKEIGLKGEDFYIKETRGCFVRNPFQETRTPVILVADDVLRKLPTAQDWDEIADAAQHNQVLRNRVNRHIAHIWEIDANRSKEELRNQALSNKESFETLLDAIHAIEPKSYDVNRDNDGLLKWSTIANKFTEEYPLLLHKHTGRPNIQYVYDNVKIIITQFRNLIENNGLNKELYKYDGKPRRESTAQRLFFAVAYCYCKANNIDISPEVDAGNGRIDFKFSKGFDSRVLVEVKLSTNSNTVTGYQTQLEVYKNSEETKKAFYVVIDVGRLGDKYDKLIKTRNDAASKGDPLSDLEMIDGIVKESASKR